MSLRTLLFIATSLLAGGASVRAQETTPPLKLGDVTVSGSFRSRVESWDWFGPEAAGEYVYSGSLLRAAFARSRPTWDWQVELAVPVLLGLPDDAAAPAPRGALGFGASYFTANDASRNAAAVFPRLAFVRIKRLGGHAGQSLTLGRQEVVDGTEVTPPNATLAALKRDRIAHRIIGNFGFTHVGRTVDGVRYVAGSPRVNATVVAGRPTRGVFDVNGWGDVNVTVVYGALTRQRAAGPHPAEWRAFYLAHVDPREAVIKTDNRPLAVRQAEADGVGISTLGGHYLQVVETTAGSVDVLLWGAGQVGSWGAQSHRAVAVALEAGWQPPIFPRLKPWIRGGYNYGSGDGNAADRRHGTFFQGLPTPRVYARFPFFNMMNVDDRFGEVVARPSSRVTVRADVHALSLASAADLWYQGGGPFEPATFGYSGRPSGGASALATLWDVSMDAVLGPRASVGAYVGRAGGRRVTEAIYGAANRASFGYLELSLRF